MAGRKTIVQLEYNPDVESLLKEIDKLMKLTRKPDLVYVKLSSYWFPRRALDFPSELAKLFYGNPRVKPYWDCPYGVDLSKEFSDGDDDIQVVVEHESIDMTMVSVFYDASINPLRKVATSKAVNCWMKQKHLPREMMFVELGFNGVFTFSQDDFPKEIQYVRIDGDDSHKYLFQKEHLWNIAAKRAKYEKLMFVDSDIAPLDDVDWFKKVYDSLDKCLFTQGFKTITYLDEEDNSTKKQKKSFSSDTGKSYVKPTSTFSPGGAFCLGKSTLESIDYFNYMPLGGGDLLFWVELEGDVSPAPWIYKLCGRGHVGQTMRLLSNQSDKRVVGDVGVDVCHFFHGKFHERSYYQRDFMLSTQFPWNGRIVCDDDSGLLSWVDIGHFFHDVAMNFGSINNDLNIAASLFGSNVDYVGFYNALSKKLEKQKGMSRCQLVRELTHLVETYGKSQRGLVSGMVLEQEGNVKCERKISVITPFYNSQKFVDDYFAKLSKQTFFDQIEVICIDDCSTDETFAKLVDYSYKYDNVVLLRNDTNRGAGHSRNRGLDIAKGEYISFLDSDDWYFAKDSLERFYLDAVEHDAPLCGSAITNILPNGSQKTFFTKENDIQFNNAFVRFDDYQNIYYFTRYLYKRSFLDDHNLRFRDFKRFQDPYFLYEVMVTAKQFFAVPYSTYCYTTNDHWITLNEEQHYDRIGAISQLMTSLPEKYEKIKIFLLLSVVSLFKWDKRLMDMILSNRQLFLQYYSLFFNEDVASIAKKLPVGMTKLYENAKKEMKTSTKVTIIIPVYNGEQYIDRCLKSIFDQTYPNIEVICVDDCSTDNSYKVLNAMSRSNKNLRVFKTPKNSGCCSNPRNIGLANATGQYVQFIDIDDLLADENVIGTLVHLCQKNNLDCLRFTFKVLNEQDTNMVANRLTKYYTLKNDKDSYVNKVMSGAELYFRLKCNGSYQESAALAMFNLDMMKENGISFIEDIIHEDVLFTPMILSNSRRCMQLDQQMYLRSVHGNSIITTTNNNKKRKSFNVILEHIDGDSMQMNVVMDDLRKTIKGVLKNLK